jgi:hypothetical protein
MSDKLKLGQVIKEEQHRDAIHVAVVPIEADEPLYPGTHVGLVDGKASKKAKHIGVIDPFLKELVQEGEMVWLFLYPGSIVSLRHEWLHPAFDEGVVDEKAESEKWLREFCDFNTGIDYDEMVEKFQIDSYVVQSGSSSAEITDEFRKHFKIVTGVECKGFFSCSC